jgi:hypothetical protein
MNTKRVNTLTGAMWHVAKAGADKTLCGRDAAGETSGSGRKGCKSCVKAEAKLTDARARLEYATRAAETQDEVMSQAAPVQTPALVWGTAVDTPSGLGTVVDVNTCVGEVLVRLYEGGEFDVEHGRWFPVKDVTVRGHDATATAFAVAGLMRPAGPAALAHALPTEVLVSEVVRAGGIRQRTPEEMERAAQNAAERAKLRSAVQALRG